MDVLYASGILTLSHEKLHSGYPSLFTWRFNLPRVCDLAHAGVFLWKIRSNSEAPDRSAARGFVVDPPIRHGGYCRPGEGSWIMGVAAPLTCGIWPFHFFATSYCTRLGVRLSERRRLASAWARASARMAMARPAALMLSPCAWKVFFCSSFWAVSAC
jgi:hypothetical protein